MIAKLLPVILLIVILPIVGVGAGIGAGIVLAPAPEPDVTENMGDDIDHTGEEDAAHAEEDASLDELGPEQEREYVKIANQFVVPVVERENLSSLVVLALSLEVKQGTADKIRSYEPKLRDSFLQVLFDHANMGGFRGAFTRSDVLDPLRTALREAARKELGSMVYDVLIIEISRQDV